MKLADALSYIMTCRYGIKVKYREVKNEGKEP